MTRPSSRAAALLFAAAAIEGCGGDVAAPKSPGIPDDLTTPESALQALARAEGLLDRSLGPAALAHADQPAKGGMAQQPAPPPPERSFAVPPAEPSAAPGERPSAPPTGAAREAIHEEKVKTRSEAPAQASDPCLVACSALASMERAADHLCGLAGPADARCTGARVRVQSATARVHAACPACKA
jgi:hypothetical protein